MSICDNFEGALMKAIRSLEQHVDCLLSYDFSHLPKEELLEQLNIVDDRRIWRIAEAVRRGISYKTVYDITKIDIWFIDKIARLVEMEQALRGCAPRVASGRGGIDEELLKEAKRMEFPDNVIARLTGLEERDVHDLRHKWGIRAAYKVVDTCAAEFAAETPYYYSVYGGENEVEKTEGRKKVLDPLADPYRPGSEIGRAHV